MAYPPGDYEIDESLKVPVTCITGFLGAGKTTLLNHILTTNHGFKYAVVENEFGEIGIDSDLVQQKENMAEEIISMDNGCLCCTVRDDLVKGIRKILSLGKKLDGIIIETTGMADPGPVVQTFYQNDDLRRRCRVDGIITVVDSKHCKRHIFDTNISEGAVNESLQQVAHADRILLNKTDLVTKEELSELKLDLKDINSMADIIECCKGKVDPAMLININKFSLEKMLENDADWDKLEPEHDHGHGHGHGHGHENCDHEKGDCKVEGSGHDHGHGHGHEHDKEKDHSSCDHEHGKCEHSEGEKSKKEGGHSDGHDHGHGHEHKHDNDEKDHGKRKKNRHDVAVSSVGMLMKKGEEMNLMKLRNWITELIQTKGEELYRYKGILAVKGREDKFVFQGVHMVFDGEFMGSWDCPTEERQCKFVFIGKNLNREELETGFRECIAAPLRFKVGDSVQAKVKGGWKSGKIIKQWDDGNPYRIKLEETGVEVYGPLDDDRVVRAGQ